MDSKRNKTKYAGVFFRVSKTSTGKLEKIYYIRYRKNKKAIEEKVGHQFRDKMDSRKAFNVKNSRINGGLSNNEIRDLKKTEELKKKWTINAIWSEYLLPKKDNTNLKKDKNRYNQHIKQAFGKKMPENILVLDIDRIKMNMNKKYSNQTIKHVLELLKRIINFGVKKGLAKKINFKIEMPNVDNIKNDALTETELKNLFEAIKKDKHQHAGNLMLLALFTGMRRGELFKLKWEHINFETNFIEIKSPKGGKDQTIPLNSQAKEMLLNHGKNTSPFVFFGKNGNQRTTIQKPVNKIKVAAGQPCNTRPLHSLRHTFATLALNSGEIDLHTLQKLTTHKTSEMLKRYAHLEDDKIKNAAETAGNIIKKTGQKLEKTDCIKVFKSK